jgi:low affinity Fe/Cu permease
VRTWQLVIVLILAVFIAMTFLRLNNIGVLDRKATVYVADEEGDTESLRDRIYDLQRYLASHMNTESSTIVLESSYNRDLQKQRAEAAANINNPNGNIFVAVDDICGPRFRHNFRAYNECFVAELAKYPGSSEIVDYVDGPRPELYTHRFSSPLWSPDFAGWSIVVVLILILMIITRFISLIILKLLLRKYYKTI